MTNPPSANPSTRRQVLDRQGLAYLRPYLGQLGALSLAAVGLSVLTAFSQVLLTPLLEIVLGNASSAAPDTGFSLDLNQIGLIVLQGVQKASGLTDQYSLLLVSTLLFLFVFLLTQGGGFATRMWAALIRLRIAGEIEHRLFKHVVRLPMAYLDHQQVGALQGRLIGDVLNASTLLNTILIDGLSSVMLAIFYSALLIMTDFRLTVVVAVAGLLQLGLSQALVKPARDRTLQLTDSGAALNAFRQERLSTIREIKLHIAEKFEAGRLYRAIQDNIAYAFRYHTYKHIERPLRISVNRVIVVLVLLIAAYELLNGSLSTSAFLLFMYFSQRLIEPISSVAGMYTDFIELQALLNGVNRIFQQETEPSGTMAVQPGDFSEAISFSQVSFRYGEEAVLEDFNLTIKKGTMVALVGKSGAGKSTVVDLLLRLYLPTEGRLEIDGVPVEDYDLESYRALFGVVSQAATLFNDTVHNNIAYARPDLTRKEVEEAARIANAHSFIVNELPDGYESLLGERGTLISGGQRQRIAIARAVVHRPPVLILDEATSALDTESERLVQGAIEQVVKGSTAVVIAHRLSTIMMADLIVVMKEGKVVETGTHQELIKRDGEYTYLYNLQFSDNVPDPAYH